MKLPAPILAVLVSIMLVATFASAQDLQKPNPEEKALYDKGIKLIEGGQFEVARFTLQTLLNVYPEGTLAHEAKDAIRTSWIEQGVPEVDAMLLFEEGEARIRAGKYEAARLALQTLINVYPKSSYVTKAKDAIRTSQLQEVHNR